jgi:hypothetical protein
MPSSGYHSRPCQAILTGGETWPFLLRRARWAWWSAGWFVLLEAGDGGAQKPDRAQFRISEFLPARWCTVRCPAHSSMSVFGRPDPEIGVCGNPRKWQTSVHAGRLREIRHRTRNAAGASLWGFESLRLRLRCSTERAPAPRKRSRGFFRYGLPGLNLSSCTPSRTAVKPFPPPRRPPSTRAPRGLRILSGCQRCAWTDSRMWLTTPRRGPAPRHWARRCA